MNAKPIEPDSFLNTWKALRQDGVEAKIFPGFLAGYIDRRDQNSFSYFLGGERRREPSSQPMELATVFDLASLTKVIATTSLAARLFEQGELTWKTPVQKVLPKFRHRAVQVRHLLTHTSGLADWDPLFEKVRERFGGTYLWEVPIVDRQATMRELVFAKDPDVDVDQRALYSDYSFWLLGFLLEEVTGLPLDTAVRKEVLEPLGLEHFFFSHTDRSVQAGTREEVAASEACSWRGGVLQGQVHDDNCWSMGGYAGHAGLFGNLEGVLRFAREMLWGDFLKRETIDALWTRASLPKGCERALGWDTPTPGGSSSGDQFSLNSVGHVGFTGTSLWIDRDAELAVVLLASAHHPKRHDRRVMIGYRPVFHNAFRTDYQKG